MGRNIPYIMENKKCLKPPTSNMLLYGLIRNNGMRMRMRIRMRMMMMMLYSMGYEW
jgi:hypothetical protein